MSGGRGWLLRGAQQGPRSGHPLAFSPGGCLTVHSWLVKGSMPRGRARQNVTFLNLSSEVTGLTSTTFSLLEVISQAKHSQGEENWIPPLNGRNIKECADKSKNCHIYLVPDVIIWSQGTSLSPYLENPLPFFSNTVLLSFPRLFVWEWRERERERSICRSTSLRIHWLLLDQKSNLQSWRTGMALWPAERLFSSSGTPRRGLGGHLCLSPTRVCCVSWLPLLCSEFIPLCYVQLTTSLFSCIQSGVQPVH